MPASQEQTEARAAARTEGDVLEVALEGEWRLRGGDPAVGSVAGRPRRSGVRLRAEGVPHWDTSLVVFVGEASSWCADAGIDCDLGAAARADAPPGRAVRGVPGLRGPQRPFAEPVRGGGARDPGRDGPGARIPRVHRRVLARRKEARQRAGRVPLERLHLRDAEVRRDGAADRQPDQLPRRDHPRVFRGHRAQALRRRHLGRGPDRRGDDPRDGRHDGGDRARRAAPGPPTRPRSGA